MVRIMVCLGADSVDSLFLAVPTEAVPIIGMNKILKKKYCFYCCLTVLSGDW